LRLRADDDSDDLLANDGNLMPRDMDQLLRACPTRGMPTQSITKQFRHFLEQQE